MTEKPATTKRKIVPAKPSSAARKSATTKQVAAIPAPARQEKKNKKPHKTNGKAENKMKVVRDSFTMPQNDYAKIGELKQACLKAGIHAKKSELLRAGLHALCKLNSPQLKQAIVRIEQIKTGRPKKS